MPTKRALIIGINKYLYRGEDEQLGGCVNDAKLIKSILVNKFNFDPVNIVTLFDEQATLDAIQAEMDHLAKVVDQDDIVLFHYSGHGSQCKITTEYTSEGSGKDNYILPTDDSEPTADGPVIWRDVRDHQFNEWLQRLATKTRNTTLIFDACHSGTMTRGGIGSAKARGLLPDDRPRARGVTSAPECRDGATGQSAGVTPGASGWLALSDNYVVIAGCRDTQTSAEDYFTQDGQSVKHGLLSYYLTGALLNAMPGTTYRDVFEHVCSGVVSQNPGQNPQIEGAVDRELFGVRDIEPLRFLPVSEVNGSTLTLDGGAAHGLRCGSRWAIYPPGTKLEDRKESLGVLQINQVGALSSTGVIVGNSGSVVTGARCVEIDAAKAVDPLQVNLNGLASDVRALMEPGIKQSRLLQLADTPNVADIHATIIDPACSVPDSISDKEAQGMVGPTWALFENHGALCMPLHPVTEPGVIRLLLRNLEKIARYRNVLRLDNPITTLNVEFNLYRQAPDSEWVLANGGNSELRVGEPLMLELINHDKDRAVFFSILWFSASGEIQHFYPPCKASEELSPGKTIRIGDDSNKLRVAWDASYFADVGSECCKVVFSTAESDFSWLNQEGMRSAGGSSSNVSAFDEAYRGASAGIDDMDQQKAEPVDWGAVNRSFVVTR